jgi:hypothetical protein
MTHPLEHLIDLSAHPLSDKAYQAKVTEEFDETGVLCLDGFLHKQALADMVQEAAACAPLAHFANSTHNVYLTPPDESLPDSHVFNRQVTSSKGCITTDQVPADSGLHRLYHDEDFKAFICAVTGQEAVYPYADPLSSINVHYAHNGQELGWHFDNSSFAITLLLQAPEAGGQFEYVKDLRDADRGEMNFDGVADVLDQKTASTALAITPGTLVLFRGRNAMHRVTPTIGDMTRILVVLAYNDAPDIALSESARMTFFGRLG